MKELRTGLEADRSKMSALKAEASAGEVGRMPTTEEVAETARYITSLAFLNELDEEFADSEPYEVRVAKCREMLRTFFKGGHITLTPLPDERVYLAELVVLPMPMAEHKRRTPQLAAEAYDIRGCAGRI